MALHIIIDGYNMIYRSKRMGDAGYADLQESRDRLIQSLHAYKKLKRHRITVVFDGTNAPSLTPWLDQAGGIEIRFSRRGESADTVIKRMANQEKEKALVVSSDRDIVTFAADNGAAVVSADEFESKISQALLMNPKDPDGDHMDEPTGWIPTTKKKGPARRLSKKDRKMRLKLEKI